MPATSPQADNSAREGTMRNNVVLEREGPGAPTAQ